jgi:hypothetical protein
MLIALSCGKSDSESVPICLKKCSFKMFSNSEETILFLLKVSDPQCNLFPAEFKTKLESHQPRSTLAEKRRKAGM